MSYVNQAFEIYDEKFSGYLEKEEIVLLFRDALLQIGEKVLDDKEIEREIKKYDTGNDGKISPREMVKLLGSFLNTINPKFEHMSLGNKKQSDKSKMTIRQRYAYERHHALNQTDLGNDKETGNVKNDDGEQTGKQLDSIPFEHKNDDNSQKKQFYKFAAVMTTMQIVIIILFSQYVRFVTVAGYDKDYGSLDTKYAFYQDVHVMIFVGFGFLMTFTKYHSWSSVMFNFLISALCIQWAILCVGFFHNVINEHWAVIDLSIDWLVEGDFGAGCVMITFGALLGKVNPLQLTVIIYF